MKKISVFINVHTVINLRFTEARILCDNGNYGEINSLHGFVRMTMYTGTYDPMIPFQDNMDQMDKEQKVTKVTTDQSVDHEHVKTVAHYLADNEEYSLHYVLLDPAIVNISREMSYFIINSKTKSNEKPERFIITVATGEEAEKRTH